jgi:pimeloyl-ACP methyl ester carboxylesterase
MRAKSLLSVVMLIPVLAGGCAGAARSAPMRSPGAAASRASTGVHALTGAHPCPGQTGFTCSTLTVPLDHSGHVPGTLDLQVATADNAGAPRGILLLLTGGPGQPGVPFAARLASRLAPVLRDYRLVMFDQRGTGEFGAINCAALQAAVGDSDVAVPPPDAVRECAATIGPDRRFYSTRDTVADIDTLRGALGARSMVVDGVSYGTYVAERYALAHPDRVTKLVLDSVLPHADPDRTDAFYLVGLQAVARVLRLACQAPPACGFDPAQDVAWLVRHGSDGVKIFDMLVIYEFIDTTYRNPNIPGIPDGFGDAVGALHAARLGSPDHLNELIAGLDQAGGSPADFSSGLHAATLCTDMRFPWGSDAVPVAQREAPLERATARLTPAQAFPFTATTAEDMGFMQTCLNWTATPPAPAAGIHSMLPRVPVLLLAGDHDLSTPLEWAREEAARAPLGQLVIVKGAAHSIQSRESGTEGRDALFAFLRR